MLKDKPCANSSVNTITKHFLLETAVHQNPAPKKMLFETDGSLLAQTYNQFYQPAEWGFSRALEGRCLIIKKEF